MQFVTNEITVIFQFFFCLVVWNTSECCYGAHFINFGQGEKRKTHTVFSFPTFPTKRMNSYTIFFIPLFQIGTYLRVTMSSFFSFFWFRKVVGGYDLQYFNVTDFHWIIWLFSRFFFICLFKIVRSHWGVCLFPQFGPKE